MASVNKSVEFAPSPANKDDDLRIERSEEAAKRSNRQAVKPAALDSRHHVVTDARASGRVDLAQAKSMSQGACRAADLEVIHYLKSSQAALTHR
jgi:hypothetical protein